MITAVGRNWGQVYPAESDVKDGIDYGQGGDAYTGTYSGDGTPDLSETDTTLIQEDTTDILNVWGKTFTVSRNTPTYEAGMATDSWEVIGSIDGDEQPVDSKTVMLEAGLKTKSKARIFSKISENVTENDRITMPDGSYMYINYIKEYEDHWVIYLKADK